jgi:addiction module RelE/StbE family toxin
MMRIRFTVGATAQLEAIFAYIARENPLAASKVVHRIEEVAEKLGVNPYMGRTVSRSGVRMIPVLPFPYLIFYEVTDVVKVIRVRHAARRPLNLNDPAREFLIQETA